MSMASRRDGLTDAEGAVMDALIAAVVAMRALPVEHPDERATFAHGIHECQSLLALRVARRTFPEGWPRHSPQSARGRGGWWRLAKRPRAEDRPRGLPPLHRGATVAHPKPSEPVPIAPRAQRPPPRPGGNIYEGWPGRVRDA